MFKWFWAMLSLGAPATWFVTREVFFLSFTKVLRFWRTACHQTDKWKLKIPPWVEPMIAWEQTLPPPSLRKSRFILRGGGSVHGLSPVSKSHQLRKICNQNLPRTCRNRFSDNGVADTSKNITPLASYFLLTIFETKDIKINKFQCPPICHYKNRCLQGTNICVKLYPKRPCARLGILLLGSDQNLSGFGFLVQIRAFAGICKFEYERKTQSGRMMLTCRWSISRSSYERAWNNCVIKNALNPQTSFVQPIFSLFLILSRRVQLPYLENMVWWLTYHDG